jgi:uncharacterized protein (TIGR02611 family)
MSAKRVVQVVLGFFLLLAGGAMLLLPGPGWLTIALGLALLAREYHWARRLLDRLKRTVAEVRERVSGSAGSKSRGSGERAVGSDPAEPDER